ncbi:hypothetical protein K449DRAFT_25030 [Hypoxylon sp. EC38]|nr:hypothetical protein K449DRAFT_25030 [Hypoxylon sp. EC38]
MTSIDKCQPNSRLSRLPRPQSWIFCHNSIIGLSLTYDEGKLIRRIHVGIFHHYSSFFIDRLAGLHISICLVAYVVQCITPFSLEVTIYFRRITNFECITICISCGVVKASRHTASTHRHKYR